jgi:hypothetical protein
MKNVYKSILKILENKKYLLSQQVVQLNFIAIMKPIVGLSVKPRYAIFQHLILIPYYG